MVIKSSISHPETVTATNVHYYSSYSSAVIDNLYSQSNQCSNIGVVCLYADYKDQSNQTLVHIVGSFLHQLLTTAQTPIPDEIIQRLRNIQNQSRKAGIEDILTLLKIRLRQLKRTFICVDAVDELEPSVRQQLLSVLKELLSVTNPNACLFLTGRSHIKNEVMKHLIVTERFTVTISASEQDIREFVVEQIKKDTNPDAMDEELAKDIADAIIRKSQQMWVSVFKLVVRAMY